ncbi:LD-carboxypeptidase [Sphingomonas antarctica]|uniref:LD-carboxypeptidase n=1 Tax=Sphingomonas antarctica TaxID=2040274 RepID=UPI0039EA79DF
MKIAVVAPSNRLPDEVPDRVRALVRDRAEIVFHPQCFLSSGHFAGPDQMRENALVEVANDPAIDAVWFARGGYGAGRIAETAIARLGDVAREKTYLGYSDAGFLLAGLHKAGFGRVLHGPMPADIRRIGGEAAVSRAVDALLAPPVADRPQYAFNLTVLSSLLGTAIEPDFSGRALMIEEVDEHAYRIDRMLFHVTSQPAIRRAAGLMLGRCDPVPDNDPDFGEEVEAIARYWCARSHIPYLGRADIGHDADNAVVRFS